jgi:hypothetical protein
MLPLVFGLLACGADSAARDTASDLPVAATAAGFWDLWGDGQAELDGYRLTQPRYGELRRGEAVQIWVTETFTGAQRVKSDGGHDDEFPVLKLNEVRHFQTGIYDYHVLTSAFVRLDGQDRVGRPTKISQSVQEWCGQVYEEWVAMDGYYHRIRRSYFDGENDLDAKVDLPPDGVLADVGPFIARGLPATLPDGEVDWLPLVLDGRFAHQEPAWTRATWSRGPAEDVVVPAGTFRAIPVTVAPKVGLGTTWWVEEAAPHRIVRWTRPDGEKADLTGSIRTKYWSEHDEGDEAMRKELGLGDPSWLR